MKKICSLILIVIAIISTTIYQYYYHDGSPNNIVILDESHELVDTSIKETVSSRILAVYLDEPYYYYLGYDGIGRYDIRNHMLDVLEFEIYGDETGKHKINYSRSKMIVNKKSKLEAFSKETLDNFEKMLMNSERGAKYYNKRWYHSGYEATFLDLDKHLIITNDVRGIKETPNILVYFDESIAGKKVRDSLITMLKYNYGDYLTILNSLDEIGKDERTILLQLRDNYVNKK